MGQFHFDVPDSAKEFIENSLWSDAYVSGIEGVPWQSTNQLAPITSGGVRLTITRGIESSGKLYLTCPVQGIGYCTLSTCSLRPLEESHLLLLELARGSCYRARIQSDVWERAGLVLSDQFRTKLEEGTSRFLDAAQFHGDPGKASTIAMEAISILEQAIEELGDCYAVQSISFRKERENRIGTLLGASIVPPSPPKSKNADTFCNTFNAASVRLSWADIETDSGRFDYEAAESSINWCAENGLRVIGGPLIDFRERLLPHWLYLLEDDFDAFLSAACQYVDRTVQQLRGKVQLWNCAAGLNTPGPLKLDDEQVMRLAVGILQTVRRSDPQVPAIITFDQPFGEYLSKHRDGISPLHFADAIARSGLGIAGFGLDVRMHFKDKSTLPRSAVDFGQLIDRWATLSLPLLVQIAVPGELGADETSSYAGEALVEKSSQLDPATDQLRIAGPLIRTMLAKHIVHGIIWDGWSDAEPHVLAHSGVIDANGQPRPLLEYLTRLRHEFLV